MTKISGHEPKITVSEMLENTKHVVQLSRENDAEMLAFFNKVAMGNKAIRLLMQRNPRFYEFYDQRGGNTISFGLRDSAQKLLGTGTMISTPCFVNGEKAHFVYLCDLRIDSKDPDMRKEWRSIYAKLLHYGTQFKELGENCYLVSALLADNVKVKKVVDKVVYEGKKLAPLVEYSMVNLVARKPFAAKKAEYKITRGGTLEEIEEFLISVHKKQAFGFNFGEPDFELRRRLKTWKDFSLNDFFVVRRDNKIVAVTALWSSDHCKQTIVEGPLKTKLSLRFLHMTHLAFSWELSREQKLKIFSELLDCVWPEKSKRKAHALAFCDFKDYSLQEAASSYFKLETKLCLYMVMPEGKVFNKESLGLFPPAFEMVLA